MDAADPPEGSTAELDPVFGAEPVFEADGFAPGSVDTDVDEEFAPRRRQRLGRPTAALAVLVVAAGGFLAGAYVQKTQAPAAASAAGRPTGGGAAFAGVGRGAGRTGGTGATTATGAGGTASPPTSSPSTADSGPAVIGQIVKVSGNTVVVQNLGGQQVTVTLNSDTAITKAATASDLAPGQTVTVSGNTGSGGAVDATTVVTK